MARAYDTWNTITRMNYNPDGTMKPEKRKRLLEQGASLNEVEYLEDQKMPEVKDFEEREQDWLEKFGYTYSERPMNGTLSQAELKRRQKSALRNYEDISELPIGIEPDDYDDARGLDF